MLPGTACSASALMLHALRCLLLVAIFARPFSSPSRGVAQGSVSSHSGLYPTFKWNNTIFEHLALHPDPSVGWVYIGARDQLFQLDPLLQLKLRNDTGPVIDSPDCLPPVTETNCPQAKETSNHNKLLLVDPYSMELITCGSVNQGICQKRNLTSINVVLFSTDKPVDTQYVAANHPNVSTVGLVVRSHPGRQPVLFVGRGYTSSHPPISTRNLAQAPIFSYEETAKLAVAGRLSEYDHHFVASFAHRHHVYFFFYRRDLKSQSREYRTYVSRVCLDDQAYYSYVEVPLTCRSRAGKMYNLLQAVQLGFSKNRAKGQDSEILLGVFSTHLTSSSRPSEDSALCMFNLEDVDRRINSTRDLCYTQMGREGVAEAAYIEYEVKSNCANLPENTLDAYPCGSDHTPSPMASRIPVLVDTILDSPSARLTAVAVSMREGYTIAFLGDSKGKLHKVFLGPNGEVVEYSVVSIQKNTPISSDLVLDQEEEHLFIMTRDMLQKRPVAECQQHPDCHSCLLAHDPYCGWCILEGRCVLRSQCGRGDRAGQWLWSFDIEQQCLSVQELNPFNISREESRMVTLSVPGLPVLEQGESYSCLFQDSRSPAAVTEAGVTCQSPDSSRIPMVPPGQDFITLTLSVHFGDVTVTARDFTFYDCMAVKQQSGSSPCRGCVLSKWGCNWCVHQHSCTHKAVCEEGAIIYNQHFKLPTSPPPTAKPMKTIPTSTTTAATVTMTTSAPFITPSATTAATTSFVPVAIVTSGALATSPAPSTEPPQPSSSAPPPAPPSRAERSTAVGGLVVVTRSESDQVAMAAAEVLPVTGADGLSGDQEAVMPLVVSDTSTLNGVTQSPPSEETLSVTSPDDDPQPTTTSVGGAAITDPSPSLDLTPSPSLSPEGGTEPDHDLELDPDPTWKSNQADVLPEGTEEDTARLSGDGEDRDPPSYAQLRETDSNPELDYQDDPADAFLPGDEGPYISWGSSACPCVEKVQGSSLLPVQVERKITLLARNLHLYQDAELDYECVLVIEGQTVVVEAFVESDDMNPSSFYITCQLHKYSYSVAVEDYSAMVYVKRRNTFHVDTAPNLHVTLYNCSVGRSDCSRCHTADQRYGCVWCSGHTARCLYSDSCSEQVQQTCPAPVIHSIEPLSGLLEGGTLVTISGSNLGQKAEDIVHSVTVAGVPCAVLLDLYEVSSRIVCRTGSSGGEKDGPVSVTVSGGALRSSSQLFSYQDPSVTAVSPERGPKAGGTTLTISGRKLLTGLPSDLTITVGQVPCKIVSAVQSSSVQCVTGSSSEARRFRVTLHYGSTPRHLHTPLYNYTHNPSISSAWPAKSFLDGGRLVSVSGHNLDVVQKPHMVVNVFSTTSVSQSRRKRRTAGPGRAPRKLQDPVCCREPHCPIAQVLELCEVTNSSLILCRSPIVNSSILDSSVSVQFLLDSLCFNFSSVSSQAFTYQPNPVLKPLNQQDPLKAYRYNPGSFIQLEGDNLDLAITKEEVVVLIGEGVCAVKTLTRNHLYCEPPPQQPSCRKCEGSDNLPEFTVQMGHLNISLGKVQYDNLSSPTFPLEAQIGVGVGASIVALIVLMIVLIYRRKSKQALRDYKKVQIQLENLETSVRDRCKKEFTDLMTEMMDMSSDLVGSGIPFLDYRMYAERIFFPGHRESPLRRGLDMQECRRQTVEQGLIQLSNLLNSKLFLTKFIHTLESQRTFSPRDRAYVASLLTVALHGKLEYFTDILKTLLNDLVEQYVAKNPKLMLRRTETVVEKLLTNWMSICLYTFLRDSAGESLYMLFKAIKHQVDKGPVDAVTRKAKYTLNDNRLLREDVEYKTLTLNVLVQGGGVSETQPLPSKVLDCDTITQVKEKLLDQVYKSTSFSHRPHADSLDLEWRSGVAGHLILSDEDLTSVVQGSWKRLNTLQHYKVPDGATVALVPRHTKNIHHDNHDYIAGEKTPMLEDADEGGVKLWHLVKASEEPELPKHRRGSLRERERAKAIPEIYLTRLLSMKGTLQKFVDDLFTVILSTSRPVPLAVKYFFDLLDDQAGQHSITDPETIHIWKTNSLPLRFWINIIKNPQFIFDVQVSDHVDAVLSVIAQTFMDSCTIADHKLGRDSPINKLLYARDIPRYKQMVERYYADIRQTISASDQEMNSALAELSRNYSGELNYLVALHELYKYINKYYDQIITALEEDTTAQKMQLGYRLQQIAAAVENKVTDL
ncbi:plexin-B1-like isoform X1 [Xiphophorus hellerii]|uniref:plexin-B1-like isoform X1 n=1 Tax=Xiphophorus hellerii TaxID=8084 RepID=UPI0013B40568|nr:plexin-B1-like isoform X1 [Xiphophorus hellerii]XP_032405975.1 plexin-B1-like isoform X1 [Xiphophorus hellerii]XP_032405976.1 plexin-B1-like isoform X1 [Xiphophorus hellerii]XP_032405977.1 plexin-B1-like isoform X1 [Xiphophorus hellerii]